MPAMLEMFSTQPRAALRCGGGIRLLRHIAGEYRVGVEFALGFLRCCACSPARTRAAEHSDDFYQDRYAAKQADCAQAHNRRAQAVRHGFVHRSAQVEEIVEKTAAIDDGQERADF